MAQTYRTDGIEGRVVPLYRSPTLTDEEREAVEWSINNQIDGGHQDHPIVNAVIVTLRKLLERMQ
jgi:hypothetical protein